MTSPVPLRRFQHWLTQTLPVCQRHHVFRSTRVHDHIQQVTRFVRRERVVANRQSVQPESRNTTDRQCPHVLNFSLLLKLSGFHLNSPSTCAPTRRSTHMTQIITLATEAAILVSTRATKSSMTDLSTTTTLVCFHDSCRLCHKLLPLLLHGLDLHQISHVVCASL